MGSGLHLEEAIGKAAAAKAATTLGNIARDAGCSDNWDRMITVYWRLGDHNGTCGGPRH
ncbi:hypothetical protein AB0L63_25390 [Nocardia sp. NPDC051990]|uniref:hypothetical protein n=1 Tax=Nocardia sp. NPDC051990 TaxID=3155285 RepID=UPI003444D140